MSCLTCGGKILHGAVGLAKVGAQLAGIPVDTVPLVIMQERREECRGCDEATREPKEMHLSHKGLNTLSMCRACGCNVAAKTRLASESCPRGKWQRFEPAKGIIVP